jgi:hypothetical protein
MVTKEEWDDLDRKIRSWDEWRKKREKEEAVQHASDCAVHNAPALPIGPCDCGASIKQEHD